MELKDAIKVLDYHQRWRQGIEDDMKYTPSQLTTALDLVLEQVKKINIDDVSNCCPNCDSVDIEISKRCNECSAHFD
jgi:hypothetical protein